MTGNNFCQRILNRKTPAVIAHLHHCQCQYMPIPIRQLLTDSLDAYIQYGYCDSIGVSM